MQSERHGPTVLLAEDDPEVRSYLEMAIKCQGYTVEAADNGDDALKILDSNPRIAAVLLDIVMPRRDGLETLREIRTVNSTVPVIMISGASSPLNVVEAMKSGAYDFLGKPVTHADLRKVLRSAIDARASLPPAEPAAVPVPNPVGSKVFFGHNAQMRELCGLLPQIGVSDAPILILGETGTGKEVIARELHAQSARHKKAFLKVNCAALPSELVESELFGYERGAFTGAFQRKPGLFELADEGTIFLDEIGDMDFKLQAKLLQVLQDSEFQRIGGKETIRVNVRVISATHADLHKSIRENSFRQDLYYRLNVVSVRLPPLRERREDVAQLAAFLLQKHSNGKPTPAITPALRDAILNYDWPGNIRELENVMRKLIVMLDPELVIRDLRTRMTQQSSTDVHIDPKADGAASKTILEQVHKAKADAETAAILAALDSTQWNRKNAAMLLKIDYKALLYKMKKLGIDDNRMAKFPGAGSPGSESQSVLK